MVRQHPSQTAGIIRLLAGNTRSNWSRIISWIVAIARQAQPGEGVVVGQNLTFAQ
jgi:hypothetical protein